MVHKSPSIEIIVIPKVNVQGFVFWLEEERQNAFNHADSTREVRIWDKVMRETERMLGDTFKNVVGDNG